MKKKHLLMMVFLAIAGMVSAQNALSVENFTLPKNGGSIVVNLTLGEADVYTSYGFKVETPAGVAYVVDASDDVTCTLGTGHAASHSATAHWDGTNSVLTVGVASMSSALFSGQSLSLEIPVAATASAVGTGFNFTITDITFIRQNGGVKDNLNNVAFTATVGDPVDTRVLLSETATAVPDAATGVDVRVNRTINANEWSTICLPFAMNAEQVTAAFGNDVQLGDFTGCSVDGDKITVNFCNASTIEANHPYIIKVSSAVSQFTADGVDIAPGIAEVKMDKDKSKYNYFIGNYVNGTVLEDGYLFLNANKFYFSTGLTCIKAYRGYFNFVAADAWYESRIALSFDETTGIQDVKSVSNDKVYNLSGQQVEKPSKGLYIQDGKKVIIK